MRTVIVLSGFADTTTPWRTFGRPGPCSAAGGVGSPLRSRRFARCFWRQLRRCAARLRRRSARCSSVSGSAIRRLPSDLALDVDPALACDRQGASEVALRAPQRRGVLELAGGVLEAQVEQLLARVRGELDELRV